MTLEIDRIYCGDCLDLMREIPDQSVDLVLTDPPVWGDPKTDGTCLCRLRIFGRHSAGSSRIAPRRSCSGYPPFSSQAIVSKSEMV